MVKFLRGPGRLPKQAITITHIDETLVAIPRPSALAFLAAQQFQNYTVELIVKELPEFHREILERLNLRRLISQVYVWNDHVQLNGPWVLVDDEGPESEDFLSRVACLGLRLNKAPLVPRWLAPYFVRCKRYDRDGSETDKTSMLACQKKIDEKLAKQAALLQQGTSFPLPVRSRAKAVKAKKH